MAKLIIETNLSLGWLSALEWLRDHGGKEVHLNVAIDKPGVEEAHIRKILDEMLDREKQQPVSTVANTYNGPGNSDTKRDANTLDH